MPGVFDALRKLAQQRFGGVQSKTHSQDAGASNRLSLALISPRPWTSSSVLSRPRALLKPPPFASYPALTATSSLVSGSGYTYPQGRSKVQVAVLTGYAATGGGFNNYLGALRSRGLIKGAGDSLRITETGIRELGPWEPLPMGSALVDYWRGRLGKAERLILEMLTQGQGS